MRRIAVFAASAALMFAACGGDEEEPAATPAATEAATEAPTEAPTEEAAASGGGATLAIAADPGGANAFTETELEAAAGDVTIEFANESSKPHSVVIEGVDGAATETVQAADAPPVDVTLEAGEYTYFCPVGNHRADGMEGKLTVR
ncbi:cupredoxin domain-containing protein [Solirubrobacter sp. CPCC 204708]|uniref:Cupredoxin domain-containing protein n=1 Tax=Solirubrobacter deserti TaxID=2282478 RepID=A0ABT4RGX4_9ACTN|nr:cupredoxin domain-containing protein [Solirubrobacter deserti]MBE2315361.1 cupredoxin domain-containing protein [Solirubrobacter deserti]MDA0137794.1 cupredoxin domain-containing protein [Solirubrobacter deserti]